MKFSYIKTSLLKKFFTEAFFRRQCVVILLVSVVLSGVAGSFWGGFLQRERYKDFLNGFRVIREDSDKYTFINPLIGNLTAPATDVGIFVDLKDEINSYLEHEKEIGNLYSYSLYFRDLSSGLWFGINESSAFFPASLFKLPIAIAAYKEGEENPAFLTTELVYTQELANQNMEIQTNADSSLVVGRAYTVDSLIELMLINSDNGAKDLLANSISKRYISDLFRIVSLSDPVNMKSYEVSSRKYAHFLRVLYGSSYINEEHSEKILEALSKSTFRDGMVAGIPGNIKVAHKFGVYQFEDVVGGVRQNSQQLHDCGVVYDLNNPYLFCFMTKGKDLETLYKIISHVSNLVYTYKDNQND